MTKETRETEMENDIADELLELGRAPDALGAAQRCLLLSAMLFRGCFVALCNGADKNKLITEKEESIKVAQEMIEEWQKHLGVDDNEPEEQ